jgi:hypothetical protein
MASKSLSLIGIWLILIGARVFKIGFDLFVIHWFAPKFRNLSAFFARAALNYLALTDLLMPFQQRHKQQLKGN